MKALYELPGVVCFKCGSKTFEMDIAREPEIDLKKPCDPLMLMLNGVTEFVRRHYLKCDRCGEKKQYAYEVPEQTVTFTFYPKQRLKDNGSS